MLYSCWVNKCYIMHRTRNSVGARLLLYSAKFYQQDKWNIVKVETVGTGGRVYSVPAIFCHILPGFYRILPTGQVEYGGGRNGGNRWAHARCHGVVP